jgi:hypothetical protein
MFSTHGPTKDACNCLSTLTARKATSLVGSPIARGTLPLAIFGPKNYAYRLGLIGAPSRICQALAPLGFGLLIEPLGRGVVAVSSLLSLAALVALLLLPRADHPSVPAASPAQ